MSDNLMLDSQIYQKDEIIKQLKQRIEQLEIENKIWQDKVFSQAHPDDDIKQTQSIMQQIKMPEIQQMDNIMDSRIEEDEKIQYEMKKKEDYFCPQCKELYFSLNRSIHNSFELKRQSMELKTKRIKYLDSVINQQIRANLQAVEVIQSKDKEIKQHLTNLLACKKYINSMEKK